MDELIHAAHVRNAMSTNVDGRKLANEIDSNLRLFAYMNEHDYTIGALWILMTSLRDIDGKFLPFYSGRWYIGSNKPGCGKSLVAKVAIAMCYNGKAVMNPTPPAMVANYHELRRTVAFEEFDQYMGRGNKPTITTIINGGWEQDASVENVRNNAIVEYFITGPMLLVGKNLQQMYTNENFDTIKTRSFITALERKPADAEVIEYNKQRHGPRLANIRDNATRWGMRHAESIIRIKPDMPTAIINRDRDIYKVLFQIAEYIGGNWPDRILRAANAKVLNIHDDQSMPILTPYDELLAAVRSIFDSTEGDFITTSHILQCLNDMPDSWWHYEWDTDRESQMGLSSALKTHDIFPTSKRIGDQVLRGYERDSVFTDSDVATVATSVDCSDRSDLTPTSVPDTGWDE